MNEKTLTVVAVFLAVVFIVLIAIGSYTLLNKIKRKINQNKVNHFGDTAEKKVAEFLKKSFRNAKILESVYLKTPTGLTEIDILMICSRGIFIIEVKSHNGYIDTSGKYWTQHWNNKVIRFHNPVYQNNSHKSALDAILRKRQSLASLPVYTVVVFTSKNVSFSNKNRDVIKFSKLYSYVKEKKIVRRMNGETVKTLLKFIESNMEKGKLRQIKHRQRIYNQNSKKRAYRFNK